MVLQISFAKGQSKSKWFIVSLESQKTQFLHPFKFLFVRITFFMKEPHENLNLQRYLYFSKIFAQENLMTIHHVYVHGFDRKKHYW
jgi:hypothetical protein